MKRNVRAGFEHATLTLGAMLAEHKEAQARGERGALLVAMADRIRERASVDPTRSRGETFEDLQSIPSED